jgi:hypothetical protein
MGLSTQNVMGARSVGIRKTASRSAEKDLAVDWECVQAYNVGPRYVVEKPGAWQTRAFRSQNESKTQTTRLLTHFISSQSIRQFCSALQSTSSFPDQFACRTIQLLFTPDPPFASSFPSRPHLTRLPRDVELSKSTRRSPLATSTLSTLYHRSFCLAQAISRSPLTHALQ